VSESTITEEQAPVPRAFTRRLVRGLAFIVLAVLALWGFANLDRRALVAAFAASNPGLLVAAAVANCVALICQAWRWHVLLRSLGEVSYARSLRGMLASFSVSSVVPARAGELFRLHLMAREMGVSRVAVAGAMLLDHVLNAVAILPFVMFIPFARGLPSWIQKGVLLAVVVVLAASVALWFMAKPGASSTTAHRWGRWIAQGRHGLGAARSVRVIARALGAAIVAWVAEIAMCWLSLRAFDPHARVATAILVLAGVNLALGIPSPPANLGTFEMGAVLAVTAVGMERERAVAFALVYHVVQLITTWLMSLPAWLWLKNYGLNRTGRPSLP
jgi:uncharacterized membrane protein YbhN (UPF0104 family)